MLIVLGLAPYIIFVVCLLIVAFVSARYVGRLLDRHSLIFIVGGLVAALAAELSYEWWTSITGAMNAATNDQDAVFRTMVVIFPVIVVIDLVALLIVAGFLSASWELRKSRKKEQKA